MITLHGVTKTIGRGKLRRTILDNVTWHIQRARYVILAQKGAGKSTLHNLISGSIKPTEGWIERRASLAPGRSAINAFQDQPVRRIARTLARLYNTEPDPVIAFVQRFARLEPAVMNAPVKALPSPMRQRLSYAVTYAIPCDFYLFDDNVGPQKGQFGDACRQAFEERSATAGAMLITSSLRAAEALEGIGGVLHGGKITLFHSVDEAIRMFKGLPPPASQGELVLADEAGGDDDDEGGW